MHCVVTTFFIQHNESYVGSIGSKLKHHNPANRYLDLEHLEEELIIAWNGPAIPHCGKLVKKTLYPIHGAGEWHFYRGSSHDGKLKFHKVSKTVDNLQQKHSSFFI